MSHVAAPFAAPSARSYCSLPQHPRTPAEDERFKQALHAMHAWYSHPFTLTLLCTPPLPTGAEYTNKVPYIERGWCAFEKLTSSLMKPAVGLWDLSSYQNGTTYDELTTQMRAGRDPPLSPDDAEGVIRSLKFSYQSDTEAVIDMYRRGFVAAFAGYNGVYTSGGAGVMWAGLKWNDEEGRKLIKAIQFAEKHCAEETVAPPVRLRLEGNAFSSDVAKLVKESGGKNFFCDMDGKGK